MNCCPDQLTLQVLEPVFSICKTADYSEVDLNHPFCFTGCTDQERSLVCPLECVPENTVARDDGWRCFRICGELDFSLIGILARIADVLAAAGIGIFAVSTYNTDYILTKAGQFDEALAALRKAGFLITSETEGRTC